MVATNVIRTITVIQFTFLANVVYCSDYYLELRSTAPAIEGVNVTFSADLFKYDGSRPPNQTFGWEWSIDDGEKNTFETKTPSAEWKFAFPKSKKNNNVKRHRLNASVGKYYTIFELFIGLANAELDVNITSVLNGKLRLTQNGTERSTDYISSATPLNQTIQVSDSDLTSIANASYVTIYWFVDCEYVGQSEQWNASNFFNVENATHNIEALLVASFEPRPQPQPTTTTTPATTTTPTTTTTPAPTTTTTKPTTTTKTTTPSTTSTTTTSATPTTTSTTTQKPKSQRKRRDTGSEQYANETLLELTLNGEVDPKDVASRTLHPTTTTISPPTTQIPYVDQPYICFNKSNVAPDPKKIYGYFSRNVIVRNPLTAPIVVGNTWIKREDGMLLNISWSGSHPYEFCYEYKHSPHNITVNETCVDNDAWTITADPWITIRRYSFLENSFTILFHVRNQITNHTKIITINTYEVQKQSQLSVIVVPVAFILCAIVAIIFGVAHYVQTRNRFSVEVADFNFGETSSLDLEYKSFVRRLYDSIRDVIPRRRLNNETDEIDDSSQRYGVMS